MKEYVSLFYGLQQTSRIAFARRIVMEKKRQKLEPERVIFRHVPRNVTWPAT
jgi:hypothetical protein